MARPASEQPTELELQFLKILWERSPRPVREIRDALADIGRDIAHTSVITTLNTMVKKKFLKRTRKGNAFLFSPKVSREGVSQAMLGDVIERVFDGSAKDVLVSLFDRADLDADELKELRQLLNRKVREQNQ